eukprot:CAMPEP_0182444712 /NCGR_PEP_ID=MMETSP1172-20130603/3086_1 /TAXON_ID=708627 /ORGANISM="Timspurckia oligopyrenoides, Strain CCMP3278" /LENGTH=724 /DNA_ID=CAMNT_0024640341 /DNA_START=1501 /DNA_END=3675 /DNA_ORIENTATION=+
MTGRRVTFESDVPPGLDKKSTETPSNPTSTDQVPANAESKLDSLPNSRHDEPAPNPEKFKHLEESIQKNVHSTGNNPESLANNVLLADMLHRSRTNAEFSELQEAPDWLLSTAAPNLKRKQNSALNPNSTQNTEQPSGSLHSSTPNSSDSVSRKHSPSSTSFSRIFSSISKSKSTKPPASAAAASLAKSSVAETDSVRVASHGKTRAFARLARIQVVQNENGCAILALAYNKTGTLLATGSHDGKLRVYHILKDRMTTQSEGAAIPKHIEDSQNLVAKRPAHPRDVVCLEWTKHNFLLTAGLEHSVRMWYVSSSPAAAPGRLISVRRTTQDSESNVFKSAPRIEPLRKFGHSDLVTCVAGHPTDETLFLTGAVDGSVSLWCVDPKTGRAVAGVEGSFEDPRLLFEKQRAAASSENVRNSGRLRPGQRVSRDSDLGSMMSESVSNSSEPLAKISTEDVVTACGFSRDGKDALIGTAMGSMYIYKLQDDISGYWALQPTAQMDVRGSKVPRPDELRKIAAITPHPMHTRDIMVSSNDSRLRLYSMEDKSIRFKLDAHTNEHARYGASFSPPDGRFVLCASEPRQIVIWDIAIWNKVTGTLHDAVIKKHATTFVPRNGLVSDDHSFSTTGTASSSSHASLSVNNNTDSYLTKKSERKGRAVTWETFNVKSEKGEFITCALFAPVVSPLRLLPEVDFFKLPEDIRAAAGLTIVAASSCGVISVFRNLV